MRWPPRRPGSANQLSISGCGSRLFAKPSVPQGESLVDNAMGRVQAATGHAVDTLVQIATHGRRDSDRIRAAAALISHSLRGLEDAELLHGGRKSRDISPMSTEEVVGILAARLRQTDQSELTTSRKHA